MLRNSDTKVGSGITPTNCERGGERWGAGEGVGQVQGQGQGQAEGCGTRFYQIEPRQGLYRGPRQGPDRDLHTAQTGTSTGPRHGLTQGLYRGQDRAQTGPRQGPTQGLDRAQTGAYTGRTCVMLRIAFARTSGSWSCISLSAEGKISDAT